MEALETIKQIPIKLNLEQFVVWYIPGMLLSLSFLLIFSNNFNFNTIELTQQFKEILEIMLFLIVMPLSFGISLHIGTLYLNGWLINHSKKIRKLIHYNKGKFPDSEGYKQTYKAFFANISIAFPIFLWVILNMYLDYKIICVLTALITFLFFTLKLYKDVEEAKKVTDKIL